MANNPSPSSPSSVIPNNPKRWSAVFIANDGNMECIGANFETSDKAMAALETHLGVTAETLGGRKHEWIGSSEDNKVLMLNRCEGFVTLNEVISVPSNHKCGSIQ